MAATPFEFSGQQYTIDDQGQIRQVMPDGSEQIPRSMSLGLTQAGASAQAGGLPSATTPADPTASDTTAPTTTASPTIPATPPNPGGLTSDYSVHQTGTTSTVPPPTSASSKLPSQPPRAGVVGSAVELRNERQKVQDQLDALNKIPAEERTSSQSTLIGTLNTRVAGLTSDISKAEATKEKTPSVMRGTGGPTDPFNIIDNGDGTISAVPNANYTGQITPQVVSHGNHTFVINPPTKDELAKDPSAAPHVTVAYTDTDAQQLANRTAAVAESNSAVSKAAQETNDYATRARVEMEQRVAAGEDAASVRAEQALKLQELHDAWVRADGDARRDQTSLDSYNTNRHNIAQEQLSQSQIDATAAAQARQDATQRYGYDKTAASSKYAADSAAQSAKLNAANSFMTNMLTQLSEINKALPPGSDLAGSALEGLLKYGANFMKDFAGPAPTATDVPAPADATAATPIGPTIGGAAPETPAPDVAAPDTTTPAPQPLAAMAPGAGSRGLGGEAAGGPSPVAPPAMDPSLLASAFGGGVGGNVADQIASANAAAHAATMRAPVNNLSPDGTPWANALDVARVFGRGGTA